AFTYGPSAVRRRESANLLQPAGLGIGQPGSQQHNRACREQGAQGNTHGNSSAASNEKWGLPKPGRAKASDLRAKTLGNSQALRPFPLPATGPNLQSLNNAFFAGPSAAPPRRGGGTIPRIRLYPLSTDGTV